MNNRMRRAWNRMSQRRMNWARELHYRLAHWLCQRYGMILWPNYDTRGMMRRGQRKITRKSVRAMMAWNPAKFRDRLKHVALKHDNRRVVIVDEAFTSKICGQCGKMKEKLVGNAVFRCKNQTCNFTWGRDANGARNILLRWMNDI